MPIKSEKATIAAFDFDGTITTKDTLFHFIITIFGWLPFGLGLIKFLPTFISYLLGITANSVAKEKLFSYFFKGMGIEKFNELGVNYASKINKLLNNEAIIKKNWHLTEGHKLIIISASIANWIKPWAMANGFEKVIATEVEVFQGKLTGKFNSKNCQGPEKVNRLLNEFPNRKSYQLYAYGNSNGDKELLDKADFSFYRKF